MGETFFGELARVVLGGPLWGSIRTACAPCVHRVRYLNNFSKKWSTGGGVLDGTWWALKRYHFPLVGSGWLLLFPGGPVPLFLVGSAWLLCFFFCALLFVSLEECGSGNVGGPLGELTCKQIESGQSVARQNQCFRTVFHTSASRVGV